MARVAALMGRWARAHGLPDEEEVRWRAAGILHDAVRDAPPGELRRITDRAWPDNLLHAPAAAQMLRRAGVEDEELLAAIEYHSIGHPDLTELGDFLYLADFLDPERTFLREERAALRERLPGAKEEVLAEVIALRLRRLLERRQPMLLESLRFWNRVVGR